MLATSIAPDWTQYLILGFKVAALGALGYCGVLCLTAFAEAMQDQPPGIETSWGGLGGSLGGWSMSRSLAWFLLTLVSLVLFAVVALQLGNGFAAAPPAVPPGGEAKTAASDAKALPQAGTGAVDRSSVGATGPSASSTGSAPQNGNPK